MLDIIVVAIIVIMALWGLKSGLVRSIFNLGYFIIAALIAAIVYPMISRAILNTAFAGMVRDRVAEWITASGGDVTNKLPEFLSGTLNQGISNTSDALATSLTQTVINLLSILVVFFVVRFGLKFIVHFLNIVASLPVISLFNKSGGLLIGIVNGFVIVYFLLGVATFFVSSNIMDMIMMSPLTSKLYNNNLLLQLIFQ